MTHRTNPVLGPHSANSCLGHPKTCQEMRYRAGGPLLSPGQQHLYAYTMGVVTAKIRCQTTNGPEEEWVPTCCRRVEPSHPVSL